ncbi:hypothetical protein J5N97_028073 [Dioscorea zingiberensis]|uniref:BAG domain-containing protein n=1 Tax=Dioscorea zingiberensis TaxID=325984 RepID=A0A9D5BYI9_9LILI|nr:hypothetical protein J5N97_028073 [Dioscorea zingiberensis]
MEPHHEPCSLSHQRDHNSHPYHHHQTWDSMPTMHYNGMNMMNHPNPPDYNACCNKSYPYGFHGFRPPYPQYQPPPQFYYPGPYPPYPDPYQQPYFIPPSSHCCGCPNHACHQKENTGVKIEEQSPEPEHKKSGDSSGFVQSPNYPYPVVWIPPGYLNDKNINSLKNLVHGGEEKKKTQLPWPLVWMPGNDKPEEAVKELKEINATPKSAEEPPKFKIIPLKFLENGNEKENKESRENRVRSIPVKQVEEMPQGRAQVDDDKKSSIVEKPMEKEVKKSCAVEKPMEQEVKKSCSSKQTSPTKSSKLPPVCLRVDPLPSKKRSNGSSRSPSPPGIKETKDNAKKEIKVLEIKDKSPSINVVKQVSGKVASDDAAKVMEALDDNKVERKSSEGEIMKNMTEEASDCKKVEVKKIIKSLSESDAALLIQSAYRGYVVRRMQLLEKLRKIAHVRERIDDVRTQIQQLEASKEIDSKQRAILSEIVMNLLLQLDTIQGLHPDVRERRKSVARELVCLQEKLDALGSHNSKSNVLDQVEKESKIKAPEDGAPTITVTKPFDEEDGEKQEKKTEDDEQKSAAEMAEPPDHEQEGQSQTEGHSTDSKMLVESHLISDEKEKELVDDKDDKASFPLHGEENDDKTIMQSEDSSKMLDVQPESEDEKIKLKEDSHEEKNLEMSCIEDEIEKIATMTPEIVPAQSESAEISEKLLKEDGNEESSVMPCIPGVISENVVAVEGAAIEKIEEETITMTPEMVPVTSEEKPKLEEESNGESSVVPCIPDVIAENVLAAEGAEIEQIVEETITMTPEMVLGQSESAETSEEEPKLKEDSNEESSVMPCIPDVIAENVAAEGAEIEKITEETKSETTDIVPVQREYTEICEEKTKLEEDTNEDSSMMPCNAGVISDTVVAAAAEGDELEMISEESAVMTPDIVPAKSESAEIPHEQSGLISEFNTEESASLEPTSKQGSVDHVQGLVPEEKRLMEENQKLREMLEKLLEAGKEQLGVISNLNGRVKDLERKLSQKKKPRVVKRNKKILTSTGNILSSAA